MKIATYTIALNESKHVERWLEATKNSDVRLVADTGSTDGTLEMLAAAGVIVHRVTVFPFRFDDARNAALALLPDDVDLCLSLDLDETTAPDLYDKLRALDSTIHKARIWHNTGNRWRCDRVHSRKGWRWVAPCHEVTTWFGDGEPVVVDINADIYHLPDESKPRTGYLPLLEMAVRERPTDGRMWTYLAREYMYAGDTEGLLHAGEEAYFRNPWNPERAAVCRWIGTAKEDREWLHRATNACNREAENWHALAEHHYRKGEWDLCIDAAGVGISCEPTTHYLRDESVLAWRLFDLLAIAQWNRGKYEDALHWGLKALAGNPDDERLQKNVAEYRGKCD